MRELDPQTKEKLHFLIGHLDWLKDTANESALICHALEGAIEMLKEIVENKGRSGMTEDPLLRSVQLKENERLSELAKFESEE